MGIVVDHPIAGWRGALDWHDARAVRHAIVRAFEDEFAGGTCLGEDSLAAARNKPPRISIIVRLRVIAVLREIMIFPFAYTR